MIPPSSERWGLDVTKRPPRQLSEGVFVKIQEVRWHKRPPQERSLATKVQDTLKLFPHAIKHEGLKVKIPQDYREGG